MRTRLLLPLLLVVLVAVGCSDTTDPVLATVNGTDIYLEEVELFRPIYGDGPVIDLGAFVGDTTVGGQLRSDTALLIWRQAMLDRLEADFGVTVTDAEIAAIAAQIPPIDTTGLAIPVNAEAARTFDATIQLIRLNAIDGLLDAATLQPLFEAAPNDFANVCVRHVLLETRGGAESAVGRLAGGEDFATVAEDVSVDTVPGGDLGCRAPSTYVTEFADASMSAPLDTVFGPVETQFGFHVMVVYNRSAPSSLDDLVANAATFVPSAVQNDLWTGWFNRAIVEADIEVTPWLGTWVPEGQGIAPPE
ncbi:MAG: peptidylprolyl isomerase [Acidimicrobiia bacterium]|nr:peptidylprolyl isomerase [Acidimicrobiia bacterium]